MNFYSLYFPAFGLKLPIGTAETDGKAYPLQTHELQGYYVRGRLTKSAGDDCEPTLE